MGSAAIGAFDMMTTLQERSADELADEIIILRREVKLLHGACQAHEERQSALLRRIRELQAGADATDATDPKPEWPTGLEFSEITSAVVPGAGGQEATG